jgi:3-methyladenine DNA glycosylase/8-oxoguanine DNA glycosylase
MITLTVSAPADFNFENTVRSHGWRDLAPFSHETNAKGHLVLTRRYSLSDGTVLTMRIRDTGARSVLITAQGRAILNSLQRNEIAQSVRYMFNLDWQLNEFYDMLKKHDDYKWVVEQNVGRLLSSPTVWEDLVKTLMTTNISWQQTQTICEKLCQIDPAGTFPTPQQIAVIDEDDLQEQLGAGYRTAHLKELAERIASGELNVEAWRELSADDLYKAVKTISGFGDYAAGTIMRLLGHFDKLAIDSVARNAFERVTGSAPESDTDIRDYYETFGEWRGLVLWMDCIRDDFVQDDNTDDTPAEETEAASS